MTDQINVVARYPPNYKNRKDYTYVGTQGSDQALALLKKYDTDPPNRPWGMVFNTDPISKPGEHWICLYASEFDNHITIMDSYGSDNLKTYTDPNVQEIIKRSHIVKMPQLQSFNTYVCGHYCLCFLSIKTRGYSHSSFARKFNNPNKRLNDKLVCRYVCKVMIPRPIRHAFKKGKVGPLGQPCQGCCCEKDKQEQMEQ